MTSHAVVQLPALVGRTGRFHHVPRRYEETKPVITADLSHKKILDLGKEIHQKTLEQCAGEKEVAIQEAVEATWAQAELQKQEALSKALQRLQNDHDRDIRKLKKAHEKAVKEECLRVSGEMQKLAREQVQREREEGEQRLRAAVKATEERCEQEKNAAVAAAIKYEREVAAAAAAKKAREEEDKFNAAMSKAAAEKSAALSALESAKDKERVAAVDKTRKQEQDIAANNLAELKASHEQNLSNQNVRMQGLRNQIENLQAELDETNAHKREVIKELLGTREEFQRFINKTNPFEPGKSDYMIPPLKSVVLS